MQYADFTIETNGARIKALDAFKQGIDSCLNDVDKKFKAQIASLMTLRFQVFENNQILAG